MDWKEQTKDRFSNKKDAHKWADIYSPEQKQVDSLNFQKRRDFTYDYIRKILGTQGRILDLGCGAAPLLKKLARHEFSLIGIDYSQDMLSLARSNLGELADDIPLMRGECEHIPLPDNSQDCVACLGVISYAESIEAALNEIERVLVPGGFAIVTYRNLYNAYFMDPLYFLTQSIKRLVSKHASAKTIGRAIPRRELIADLAKTRLHLADEYQIGFGALRLNGKVISNGRLAIHLDSLISRSLRFLQLKRLFRAASDIHILILKK